MTEVSILSHVTNSLLVVQIIQWLKGTVQYRRFAAWLPIAEGKVHVLMSGLGAALSGLGMHGAVTGNWTEGWKFAAAIPPGWVVLHALWDLGQQFALNQIIFAMAVQRKEAAPVVTERVAPAVSITRPLADATTP